MRRDNWGSLGYVLLLACILMAFAVPHGNLNSNFSSNVSTTGDPGNAQFFSHWRDFVGLFDSASSSDASSSAWFQQVTSSDTTATTTTTTTSSSTSPNTRSTWVWLWQNYSADLAQIEVHPGALTTVSPNIYYLFDNGTFGVQALDAEVCDQVHQLQLQCVPSIQNNQDSPQGLDTLLTSPTLQSNFIQNAVREAVNSNLDGYNVDFEPSNGIQNVSLQYGIFLNNFADAMHAVGKSVSVDVASYDGGALWNLTIEAKTSVDLILTMDTYGPNDQNFAAALNSMLATVPLNKIAIGLMTYADDGNLTQRFQAISENGISCVMVWPSYPGFLPQIYWDNLSAFMGS